MHPTIDEQLGGALRLLDVLDSMNGISPEAREVLTNIGRVLRQAHRATVSSAAFYREDNQELVELLARLAPTSGPLAHTPRETGNSAAAEAQRNTVLRGDLCLALATLPADTPERAEIGRYLLRRVEQDPT